jgi:hypothetical protein
MHPCRPWRSSRCPCPAPRHIAIPYLLLNAVVLVRSAWEIARHPEVWSRWTLELRGHGDFAGLLLAAALVFPRLALGLSGFETGVAVMPLVSARGGEHGGRVRATRKLLAAAAVVMSVMLAVSSLATTLLVPQEAYAAGGEAAGRAIAFLAHRLLGHGFGSVYDAVTIAILWFAGASALAGLLSLVPRYLPRFGMAPRWTVHARPLVLLFFIIDAAVTAVFRADVEAQAGAYATGVLALILSAAVAVALAFWNESRAPEPAPRRRRARGASLYFWAVGAVFAFTLADNVLGRPDGLVIALLFVAAILTLGALSRWRRSTELRVADVVLDDETSASIWPEVTGRKVNLVPLRTATSVHRDAKARELRRYYRVEGPIAFLHVNLVDNRSEFLASLRARVRRAGDDYVVEVSGAVAIANTIAYVSELVAPGATSWASRSATSSGARGRPGSWSTPSSCATGSGPRSPTCARSSS